MKATELLKRQHEEVKMLFKQIEKANGEKSELLEQLADKLAAHMVIEQVLFYPTVLVVKEDLVLESYEEHAIARFSLKRVLKTDPSSPIFDARLATLRELVEHHLEDEEGELFPRAEKALGQQSEGLAQEMKKLFDKTLKQGHSRVLMKGGPAVTSASAPLH